MFLLLTLLVYAAATLVIILHHEPWRDEADPWLYARDADLFTLLSRMPYAGTPGLWYLLLVPLARLGLPYLAAHILHWIIAVGAVALLLWHAPFHRLTKLLFVFSYLVAFEYVVIARSYGLSLLFLFGVAALYQNRYAQPLRYAIPVFLLFNTNAHSFLIAGAISAAYAAGLLRHGLTATRTAAAGLMAAGGAAALLQLRPPPDGNIVGHVVLPEALPIALGQAFLPWTNLSTVAAAAVAATVLLAATIAMRRTIEPLFILWTSYAWLTYIFVFKYPGSLRHHGFYLILLVFSLWIARCHGLSTAAPLIVGKEGGRLDKAAQKLLRAGLHGCLLVSCFVTGLAWRAEVSSAFSGASEMAAFIRASGLADTTIAAHPPAETAALLPYLEGKRFWFPGYGYFGSFMWWDAAYRRAEGLPLPDAERRVRARFDQDHAWLLLVSKPLDPPLSSEYELVYATSRHVWFHQDEVYYLYRPLPMAPA